MKGCPFCEEFKTMLVNENIEFYERDIDEYELEYDTFSKITENEMVPALLLIENVRGKNKPFLYAPDRNYNELTEAVDLIKKHKKNLKII